MGWESDSRNNLIFRGGYYHEDLSARDEKKFNFGLNGKVGVGDTSNLVVKGYGVQSNDETHVDGSKDATISDASKYRGEVQWSGKFADRHTFTLGTEVLYETLQQKLEGKSPDIDKDQNLESFYIQDETDLTFAVVKKEVEQVPQRGPALTKLSPISIYDKKNLLEISIEDIGKYHGDICPGVVVAFRTTQLAISEL